MNGVQTRFKCKLDVKRCKRFVFPPSSLLPRSNALKTKAIRYFQTDQTLTRIVSSPLFGSVNDDGYMHTLFVHKDFQHQGVATSLYKHLEAYARERGAKRLTSEVSITAKPFFEKQGFQVDEEQKRKANQMCLTNYKMSKQLC